MFDGGDFDPNLALKKARRWAIASIICASIGFIASVISIILRLS